MTSLLPRVATALVAMLVGGLLGALLGRLAQAPQAVTALVVLGGAVGVAIVGIVDAVRGQRLVAWLRASQGGPAPRGPGYWGELAYRIERSLQACQNATLEERQRLQQFLSAIEASPNGVMLLDDGGRIEWVNANGAEHFGLDPQRDRLQRVTNLVRAPAFVAHLQAGRFDDPVEFPAPDGRGTLSVIVRPYGGGMQLVLSQDITARERADAMRRDFVANVSHEIRTPLTVLAGFIETLSQLALTEPERARVLELMAQQAQRMQSLVGDLLTLAQLEGSPRPPADRWLAVEGLMQRARADAAALSGGRHTIVASGGDDAELAGSETELMSAVGNLVTNAVRYTPDGGRIEIAWRWRDDGSAELAVSDTGVGVPREHLPRLTERFYRVDSSRSRDTGGTGLGLSIVKHVVQRHAGAIDIQSEPGRGSCFRLVFPAVRARRRSPGVPEPSPAPASV